MNDRLIIFKLKIKSSYNQNIEQPADKSFDTLQFFVHDQTILRIKTYAIDHDIHIHAVNLRDGSVEKTIEILVASTNIHYGDAVDKMVELDIKDLNDHEGIKAMLTKEGLSPYLETPKDFIFWNPDNKKYQNQSNPL